MRIVTKLSVIVFAVGLISVMIAGTGFCQERRSDGEIMGLMMATDRNEIAAAQQAQSKKISVDVEAYAKMIQSEHTADLNKYMDLAAKLNINVPGTTGTVSRAKGVKDRALLMTKNGTDYERGYLADMIKGHMETLDLIDQLSKDAQSPDLKAQLSSTKSSVQMHLDKARDLQTKL
ncbi:MAG: DUF4142 domain-containing protein [Candidatus Omnitrophica bacterium]|nr:DUF4142 domain-containing protein [Candidatus Omnitrophota bacterium]